MTREQEIRGRDGTVHSALFVTGYDEAAVAGDELAPECLAAHGAAATEYGSRPYRQAYALSAADIRAAS